MDLNRYRASLLILGTLIFAAFPTGVIYWLTGSVFFALLLPAILIPIAFGHFLMLDRLTKQKSSLQRIIIWHSICALFPPLLLLFFWQSRQGKLG